MSTLNAARQQILQALTTEATRQLEALKDAANVQLRSLSHRAEEAELKKYDIRAASTSEKLQILQIWATSRNMDAHQDRENGVDPNAAPREHLLDKLKSIKEAQIKNIIAVVGYNPFGPADELTRKIERARAGLELLSHNAEKEAIATYNNIENITPDAADQILRDFENRYNTETHKDRQNAADPHRDRRIAAINTIYEELMSSIDVLNKNGCDLIKYYSDSNDRTTHPWIDDVPEKLAYFTELTVAVTQEFLCTGEHLEYLYKTIS